MNKREATKLARQIERDAPTCRVTGVRHYGKGSYTLDVLDIVTGYSIEVGGSEAWADRMKAVEYAQMDREQYEAAP